MTNSNLHSKPQLIKERALNYYIIHPVLKHLSYFFFKDSEINSLEWITTN